MSAKRTLQGLAAALETLRDLDQDMPIQQAITFIEVCLNEGQPFKFYCDKLGVSQSTMSRNMAALGMHGRRGKAGLKLLDAEFAEFERHRKLAVLTTKGTRLQDRIVKLMEG